MAQSALNNVQIDYCLPIGKMSELLQRLVYEAVEEEPSSEISVSLEQEVNSTEMKNNPSNENELVGKASVYSCPECGGVLREIQDGKLLRFRCRVGHAFSAQTVLAEQSEALDKALWIALRTLEEKAELLRRLAVQTNGQGRERLAQGFEGRAAEAEQHAKLLQQLLIETELKSSTSEAAANQANGLFGDITENVEGDRR
jgi:two-component system chemotaxis response regulator CheB